MLIGTVKEWVLSFLPRFEMYIGEQYAGCISKKFTFFKPVFDIDCNGWHIEGDLWEWNYSILDRTGQRIAYVSKKVWNLTDTYEIDINNPEDALCVLMLVLAIDAEKCSRND